MDSDESGACTQGLGTTCLYPTNTGEVGHGLEVSEGVIWRQGEGEAYFGVLAQALLGEMSYWDDISLKIDKHELELLDTCYRGW